MKKILMTLVAVAMATTMNAQWYVGGGVGYNHMKVGDVKTNTFKLVPEVGYNLNEKWAVGLGIGYTYQKSGDEKTNGFIVAPYLRHTFVKWEKVNLFCDLGLAYNYIKAGDVKTNTFGVGLFPGLAVNLNEKISFVTKIGALSYIHSKVTDGPKGDDFNIGLDGSDLQFSVYYNL